VADYDGVYCLWGANHLVELATMIPKAGGFYVYAERAFGRALLFFGYIYSNPYPSLYALGVLALSYPIFLILVKNPG
jgi:amino acid transporter